MNNEERIEQIKDALYEEMNEKIAGMQFETRDALWLFVHKHTEDLYEKMDEVKCDMSDDLDEIVNEYGVSNSMSAYISQFGNYDRYSDARYIGDSVLDEMFYREYGGFQENMDGFIEDYVDEVFCKDGR